MSFQQDQHYGVPSLLQISGSAACRLLEVAGLGPCSKQAVQGGLCRAVLAAGGSSPAAMALLAAGSSHASLSGHRGKGAQHLSLKTLLS